MEKIHRVTAEQSGLVDVPARRVWALLVDWDGLLKWWDNSAPGDAMYLKSIHLEGNPDQIPRTRLIIRGNAVSAGLPEENRETLLLQDDDLMRIYYDADDNVLHGVRNYMASTYIDEVDTGTCRMTFRSAFDVPQQFDAAQVRSSIVAVYDAILDGFRKYFSKHLA